MYRFYALSFGYNPVIELTWVLQQFPATVLSIRSCGVFESFKLLQATNLDL